ncbi:amino acid permease [Rhodococcus sovatensis]|uniref:Amino acid permease n=1 Tax=Rhodococcus sovatensis TaxID=1805840 RepID=A0ABZ2PLK4_9NOCA
MTTTPSRGSSENLGVSSAASPVDLGDMGYNKQLRPRQVQMIAIGGAIGTGLFLGAGGRLAGSGPALALVYAVCGLFAFLILRALGELIMYRPSSGSFVSYAREFYGEKMAFATGWLYFMTWAMTAIIDVTAIALYLKFWSPYSTVLQSTPQWLLALIALVGVVGLNLLSVRVFGELEFWFTIVKVAALVMFLAVGIVVLVLRTETDLGPTGVSVIADNGGLFPMGSIAPMLAISGVIFAYASIELLGTAAGEVDEPRKVIPRAIRTVIVRIALFYVGSIVLLSLLLPFTAYKAGESPFVTFFAHLGSSQTGAIASSVMNFVVLTAALSSLNAGMYTTGRLLRSMSANGSGPRFGLALSAKGVPYGGIMLTGAIALVGVVINALFPSQAFEIALEVAALGIIAAWATIVLCQIKLRRWAMQGRTTRPAFRLFGAPLTAYATLAFLAFVLVSMGFSSTGRWVLASVVVIVPMLVVGWYRSRSRIRQLAGAHSESR